MTEAESFRPLHRYPVEERYAIARRLRGRHVFLHLDVHRDGVDVRVYEGELVAVARPAVGTVADMAIIREASGYEAAFSLASVRAIVDNGRTR